MRTKNHLSPDPAFVGIDNGVSGSIGVRYGTHSLFFKMPVKKQQNYTKKKDNISRVDTVRLKEILQSLPPVAMCLLERPMVNPTRFKATCSALRALEATLVVLEDLGVPHAYIDSKEWQKKLLPSGVSGPELKTASVDIAARLFPLNEQAVRKHKDADGLLIAEYCRRMHR